MARDKDRSVFYLVVLLIGIFLLAVAVLAGILRGNLRGPLRNERLSESELHFVDTLGKRCGCEVTIEKDFNVEQHGADSGSLFISLNYNRSPVNYCLKDSITLLQNATAIIIAYSSVAAKKSQYRTIAVQYYSSAFGDRWEEPTCDRTYFFDLKTGSYIKYAETNRYLREKASVSGVGKAK